MKNNGKEIIWEALTTEERETLAALTARGAVVFAAPIEIESEEQLEVLGITKAQCCTWRIGDIGVTVHLTPADRETYEYLLRDLRGKYRKEQREKRCHIPGKLKPLIKCPYRNRCDDCPFPEYSGRWPISPLSLDILTENGFEIPCTEEGFEQVEMRDEAQAICEAIRAENPKYLRAILLREIAGLTVQEIADRMQDTPRNVYYFLDRAKEIGRKWATT